MVPAAQHDPAQFSAMIQQIRQSRRAIKVQKEQLAALIDNSFDAGVQRRIGEAILQKNTTANFEAAVEYNQEPFIRIARLYINVETASKKLAAIVNSATRTSVSSNVF